MFIKHCSNKFILTNQQQQQLYSYCTVASHSPFYKLCTKHSAYNQHPATCRLYCANHIQFKQLSHNHKPVTDNDNTLNNNTQQRNNQDSDNNNNNNDQSTQQQQQQQDDNESWLSLKFWYRVLKFTIVFVSVPIYILDVMPCIGQSMEPTIDTNGNSLLVYKLISLYKHISSNIQPLKHNNIYIFSSPIQPNHYICKRVIGLSGDTIRLGTLDSDACIDLILPDNYCFVLGDNQLHSIDSRIFGPVNIQKQLYGHVLAIWYSIFSLKNTAKIINSDIDNIQTTYVNDYNEIAKDYTVMTASKPSEIALLFNHINPQRQTKLFVKHVFVLNNDVKQ